MEPSRYLSPFSHKMDLRHLYWPLGHVKNLKFFFFSSEALVMCTNCSKIIINRLEFSENRFETSKNHKEGPGAICGYKSQFYLFQ